MDEKMTYAACNKPSGNGHPAYEVRRGGLMLGRVYRARDRGWRFEGYPVVVGWGQVGTRAAAGAALAELAKKQGR
jgi:hypothetical protein